MASPRAVPCPTPRDVSVIVLGAPGLGYFLITFLVMLMGSQDLGKVNYTCKVVSAREVYLLK